MKCGLARWNTNIDNKTTNPKAVTFLHISSIYLSLQRKYLFTVNIFCFQL